MYNNLIRRDLSGFVGYVERHADILSTLVAGYENPEIALNCGTMLREVRLVVRDGTVPSPTRLVC